MTPQEWEVRCDLAACYRLVDLYGWGDFFGTHISLRVPGTDHFLLNPFGMLFDEITASSLIKVDQDGKLLSDSEFPINPAGFTIHFGNRRKDKFARQWDAMLRKLEREKGRGWIQ
jgi:ribulose-5-phosphate 4-epimerase/fuculose-1-phosphate aldolase